jgi:hypothetical protein
MLARRFATGLNSMLHMCLISLQSCLSTVRLPQSRGDEHCHLRRSYTLRSKIDLRDEPPLLPRLNTSQNSIKTVFGGCENALLWHFRYGR